MTNWDIDDPMNILSLASLNKRPVSSDVVKEKTPKQKRFAELMRSRPIAATYQEAAEQIVEIIKIIEREFNNES